MKTFFIFLLLAQLPADVKSVLERMVVLGKDAEKLLTTTVPAGGDLQRALDAGGIIELQSGVTYSASRFVVRQSHTTLRGNGATLKGSSGPALHIPPGVTDVDVQDISATATYQAVIQCGDNGATQVTREQMPVRIKFTRVTIPTHRGKRGFELNCSGEVIDSKALDVRDLGNADSQALWVGNSCGPVLVKGGEYVAASENIMTGGDTMKIVGCLPTDITVDGVKLTKPEEWRGIVPIKNLFELKACERCKLLNSTLSGSWKSGQDGWAILLTPRNSQFVRDVLIDNVTVSNVAGGVQFLGRDNVTNTAWATSQVVIRNSKFTISKAVNGARGILALYVGGMLDSTWDNITATFDGVAIVQADSLVPQGPFTMRNSRSTTGIYAVMAPGANYGNPGYPGRELYTIFENNTFADAPSQFKANFPQNIWVTKAEFDQITTTNARIKR